MRLSAGERVFQGFNVAALALVGLSMLLPFALVISSSLATESEIIKKGMVLLPFDGLSAKAYTYIFRDGSGVPKAYLVTLFETVFGTLLSLGSTAMLAYGMSKRNIPGRKFIAFAVLFTMLFNGGLIPTYMVVKSIGLINSVWSLIIPVLISVWNLLVLVSFFDSVPKELEEAAIIDGCNDLSVFVRVVLPLSLPALAAIGLFYAVFYWNQWFNAVIFINEKDLWPMQLLLRQILLVLDLNSISGVVNEIAMNPPPSLTVKTAAIVVTMLPVLVIYPFVQKYFVKGVLIGAVKG